MKPLKNVPPGHDLHLATQADLRARLILERKNLPADERNFKSSKITILLEELLKVKKPVRVATFVAIQQEPDLQLTAKDYSLCYPRVENGELKFFETKSALASFEKSPLSVPEPPLNQSTAVNLTEQDVVLVPGVVFNFKGQRIGMGKGFYDRFLAQTSASIWGVGYGFQLLTDEWESQPWDKKVQLIVTENFALDIREERYS